MRDKVAAGYDADFMVAEIGGAALDADNEKDLAVIEERYDEWMDWQRSLLR